MACEIAHAMICSIYEKNRSINNFNCIDYLPNLCHL